MRHRSEEIFPWFWVIVMGVMMSAPATSAQTVASQADTPKWEADESLAAPRCFS
jgi:hypothetical protein